MKRNSSQDPATFCVNLRKIRGKEGSAGSIAAGHRRRDFFIKVSKELPGKKKDSTLIANSVLCQKGRYLDLPCFWGVPGRVDCAERARFQLPFGVLILW